MVYSGTSIYQEQLFRNVSSNLLKATQKASSGIHIWAGTSHGPVQPCVSRTTYL